MNERLLPSDDGGLPRESGVSSMASESLSRSASLLERIRAQRERETQEASQQQQQQQQPSDMEAYSGPVHIPNYNPVAQDATGNTEPVEQPAWGTTSAFGAMSLNFDSLFRGGGEATQGLLAEESNSPMEGISPDGNYSLTAYFRMFVNDVYRGFKALPPAGQGVLVLVLIWVLWKII